MSGGTQRAERTPDIGDTVLTPRGVEQIVGFDFPTDYWETDKGMRYAASDLRTPEAPESHDPADVEAWLDGAQFTLVRSWTSVCTCSCGNCEWLVVERGAERGMSHQARSAACRCQRTTECCGYPLGGR